MDTFEPLQGKYEVTKNTIFAYLFYIVSEFISGKLPTVPEENNGSDALFKHQQEVWCYTDLDLLTVNQNIQVCRTIFLYKYHTDTYLF